ncbi:hypothetical protein [Christiangramia sabulilitoris]|uniref:ATP-grasp domain-containing protein n=1 Tax=Christiangramia sabulilitoris TaxID=2583991 RepID=A0A550I074_9FLAO|nr:hypothetical protein [Christiangramia sabulilitoris]TRO64382.1 hypothetical protein FGM01_12895 [Christiangramia sabulilitoris]
MKNILYLTDLYYEANGRVYSEEDLYITSRLRSHFDITIAHPLEAIPLLNETDLVVFRNTGPVIGYQEYFNEFLNAVKQRSMLTFNSFDGKGDIKGKQYLPELTKLGYPVIPTIEDKDQLHQLGEHEKYVLKLKNGADSIGMQILNAQELGNADVTGMLIQPFINFTYEVSFYFLNNKFQYALYAPNPNKRWELSAHEPTQEDLDFAEKFIKWNNMTHGITRIDACKLPDGSLLLVELEDLNPYLSIDRLNDEKRERFIKNLQEVLTDLKEPLDKIMPQEI